MIIRAVGVFIVAILLNFQALAEIPSAKTILELTGVKGGLVVHLG